jgi:hypothetical protein
MMCFLNCCSTGALVLSSGSAPEANCITNDVPSFSSELGIPGDPDLQKLIPGHITYDSAVLEFDVVANMNGDLTFSYVFASEEYNEWVNTAYNDVFAFYIDGVNVAMVGSIPVSIDNVNLGVNSGLYVSNDGSSTSAESKCQYDGFTTLLTTSPFPVKSGQLYHIKLGVSDAGDHIYDSVVYIKSQSLAICPAGLTFCGGLCVSCCPV